VRLKLRRGSSAAATRRGTAGNGCDHLPEQDRRPVPPAARSRRGQRPVAESLMRPMGLLALGGFGSLGRGEPRGLSSKEGVEPQGLSSKERAKREPCLCFVARQIFEDGVVPSSDRVERNRPTAWLTRNARTETLGRRRFYRAFPQGVSDRPGPRQVSPAGVFALTQGRFRPPGGARRANVSGALAGCDPRVNAPHNPARRDRSRAS
jgi:hypothetical protein